jgi:KaiC/GvpD/RAD55 family RecA-like ATPase
MNAAAQLGIDDFELPPLDAYVDDAPRKVNGPVPESAGDGGGPASSADAYRVTRLDELTAAPRAAVVQGMGLDEGAVAAIVGAPNAGKTAFAISLALAVGARTDRWLGRKVAGGPVLYFAAEAPGSVVMRARAAVYRQAFDRQPALYVAAAAPGMGGEFTSTADSDRIVATINSVARTEGEPVKLVFIDTLASCLGDGDENGEGMLRLVVSAKTIAAHTGACVVLIHHPSKGDAAGLRGHGSLAAACDAILRIEVEELTGVRTATLVKARDDATGLQIRFELEQVILEERDSFGDPRTTIVVKTSNQVKPHPRPKGGAPRQQQLLGELERRYRTGEQSWDEATVRKAGRDLGMADQSSRDALRGLQTAGFVIGSPASLKLKHPPEGTNGTK